jgi:AraC-like DNA-binding protein
LVNSGAIDLIFDMILFYHPLFQIRQDEAEALTGKEFPIDLRFGRMLINLSGNTYTIRDEKTNTMSNLVLKKEIVDIRFNRKIFEPPIPLSGFLDDSAVIKTALLLEIAGKTSVPGHLLANRLRNLFLQISQNQIRKPSALHYRQVMAVIRWMEDLRAGRESEPPKMSPSRWNRISQTLYGGRSSRIRRQLKMASAYREVVSTDDTLSSIALRAGYGSRSYFITSFKKAFALTPGALRQYYRPVETVDGGKPRV